MVKGWIALGRDVVVPERDIVVVLDWVSGKESAHNRELVSYARAHGFLVEEGDVRQALVIAGDAVFLTRLSVSALRRKLTRT